MSALDGQIALVTGSSRGIGAAISAELARRSLTSPLYANLSGLPPTCIQAGGDETLLGESLQLEQNARTAGVDVQAAVFPTNSTPALWPVRQGRGGATRRAQ